jgi:hypothetical protein
MCDFINHMNFLVVMDLLNNKLIKLDQNLKKNLTQNIVCIYLCFV